MSALLREAALHYLEGLEPQSVEGMVRRITLDIDVDGRVEMVTLSLQDGELRCASTDGRADGPHVQAALAFIAGGERAEPAPAGRVSTVSRHEEGYAGRELADALDDLLTAVARVGTAQASRAPSVEEALARVIEEAPKPIPSGLGRFIGRLRYELERGSVGRVARILDGASRLVDAIREPTPQSAELLHAWLGGQAPSAGRVQLLSDRVLIELGREWLAGAERAAFERRYLVDERTGKVYREDRPRQDNASLGPCPRRITVGLAEVEPGPEPQRIRILQYEVRPGVPPHSWERLKQAANRNFGSVAEAFRRSVNSFPALAEPFVLVSPYRVERKAGLAVFDLNGCVLSIAPSDRRGVVDAFHEMLGDQEELSWVAGRLNDWRGALYLSPFAFGTVQTPYRRLR
jgi:hypothetical protein